MKFFKYLFTFLLVLVLFNFTYSQQGKWQKQKGLYAVFVTSKGKIVVKLFEKETPLTVKNFVGLATGTKAFTDAKTGKKVKRKYYNGLTFHRVIPDFMIQGGCPLGNGKGGPGYNFNDEFNSKLVFDKPGKLAMANRGPNTNGSQFFITVVPTMELNNRHTIFGQVVEGQNIAVAISKVKRDANDKPLTPVIIKEIIIKRVK